MPLPFRVVLLLSAALCASFVTYVAASFSRAVEPANPLSGVSWASMLAGVAVAAPFWVPALIPARYPRALQGCRKACAVALLLPAGLFGSIVVHHLRGGLDGRVATNPAFIQGVVLTMCCLVCLLVLLWPRASSAKRTA